MLLPRASTAAGLLILPQALAQYVSNCGTQSQPQYLNTSLEYLIRSPFTSPTGLLQGGSGDWIWNIGTVSHTLTDHGKSGSVSQSLCLETESFIDLTSPSLGYIGCGAILHGLTYAATVNGQTDAGDCSLTLNPPCINAIQTNMLNAAATYPPPKTTPSPSAPTSPSPSPQPATPSSPNPHPFKPSSSPSLIPRPSAPTYPPHRTTPTHSPPGPQTSPPTPTLMP